MYCINFQVMLVQQKMTGGTGSNMTNQNYDEENYEELTVIGKGIRLLLTLLGQKCDIIDLTLSRLMGCYWPASK